MLFVKCKFLQNPTEGLFVSLHNCVSLLSQVREHILYGPKYWATYTLHLKELLETHAIELLMHVFCSYPKARTGLKL